MEIPTVVINEPDVTYSYDSTTDEEEESGNNSSCSGVDFDRNRLHPLAARSRKLNTTSLKLARRRRISRSDSTLHRALEAERRENDDDDDEDDDSSDDSSDDDIPGLRDRRHTIDLNPPDVALLKEKLERLKNLRRRQVSEKGSGHTHLNGGGGGGGGGGEDSVSQKRHSVGPSLPKKTLQVLRAKIGSKTHHSSHPDDLDHYLSRRRHTFGVIPKYDLPRQKRKAVKENDDALNAMLKRRPRKISQTTGSKGSWSRSSSRSRRGSSPSRQDRGSRSRKTSQSSTKAEEEDELLRLDRQSALLQMMLTEEIER